MSIEHNYTLDIETAIRSSTNGTEAPALSFRISDEASRLPLAVFDLSGDEVLAMMRGGTMHKDLYSALGNPEQAPRLGKQALTESVDLGRLDAFDHETRMTEAEILAEEMRQERGADTVRVNHLNNGYSAFFTTYVESLEPWMPYDLRRAVEARERQLLLQARNEEKRRTPKP